MQRASSLYHFSARTMRLSLISMQVSAILTEQRAFVKPGPHFRHCIPLCRRIPRQSPAFRRGQKRAAPRQKKKARNRLGFGLFDAV
jgi:hypothetical protein